MTLNGGMTHKTTSIEYHISNSPLSSLGRGLRVGRLVPGFGCGVLVFEVLVSGLGFGVSDFGFLVSGFGLKDEG